MTYISELIDVPDRVHAEDFVLKLSEGVFRRRRNGGARLRRHRRVAENLRLGPESDQRRGSYHVQQGGISPRQFRQRQEPLHGHAATSASDANSPASTAA